MAAIIKKAMALACAIPFVAIAVPRVSAEGSVLEQTVNGSCAVKSKSRLAVVIVDMQEVFLNHIPQKEKEREIPYYLKVLDYCKDNNIPVFVLEYEDNGETIPVLKNKINSLPKKSYVTKSWDDGFGGTDLEKQLICHGVESVILMGVNATVCVEETAKGALRAGFKVLTSKDLFSDAFSAEKKAVDWFTKNGFYRDSYKDLLKAISDGTVYKFDKKNRP